MAVMTLREFRDVTRAVVERLFREGTWGMPDLEETFGRLAAEVSQGLQAGALEQALRI